MAWGNGREQAQWDVAVGARIFRVANGIISFKAYTCGVF